MSCHRRAIVATLITVLALSACASGSSDTTPPPTSVPPALAFAENEAPSIAFAEDIETLTIEAGLWTEVTSNEDLETCLREAAQSNGGSIEDLMTDLAELGASGELIIADCLTGA